MIGNTIVARFTQKMGGFRHKRLDLHSAMLQPERLPRFVQECPSAMRILAACRRDPVGEKPRRQTHQKRQENHRNHAISALSVT